MMLALLAEQKNLEALASRDVQFRSTANSSWGTAMLFGLEVRTLLIEWIASKQREDPALAERIRDSR